MTAMMVAGCMLIAYGPSAVLLLAYASRRSALLILTIGSAFFWLLSIFFSSIVWIAIPPLRTTHPFHQVITVLIQEACRFALVWTYVRGEKAADQMVQRGGPKLFNDLAAGIAAGLGFGAMHTVMMYGGLLAAAAGEAAYYLPTCPSVSLFVWSAIIALFYNVLHIALTIIAIDAYRRLSWAWCSVPIVIHLTFALMTLINTAQGGCVPAIPVLATLVMASVLIVVYLVNSPYYFAKRQQRAWEVLTAPSGASGSSLTAPLNAGGGGGMHTAARVASSGARGGESLTSSPRGIEIGATRTRGGGGPGATGNGSTGPLQRRTVGTGGAM